MTTITRFPKKIATFTFLLSFLIAGCSNPASNDDDDHSHDEHPEPHSVVFIMNGEPVVTYSGGTVTGQFNTVSESQTSIITAEFYDEEGNEIHIDELDEEYFLDWIVDHTEYADIERSGKQDRWSFYINGKTAGETTVQFFMQHVDHSLFNTPGTSESNAIKISVKEPTN